MPKRGGKAASRRSRQRKAQRAAPPPQQREARPLETEEVIEPAVPIGSSDAFEKADAELRASTPPPGSRPAGAGGRAPAVRGRTGDFAFGSGSSRLGEGAATDYHYVLRDLRNIGVLLVVMAVLLAVSVLVVNAFGIGPS